MTRDDQIPPDDPGAEVIEKMKRLGLVRVREEDLDKPWGKQHLELTEAGRAHKTQLMREHPELFPS